MGYARSGVPGWRDEAKRVELWYTTNLNTRNVKIRNLNYPMYAAPGPPA